MKVKELKLGEALSAEQQEKLKAAMDYVKQQAQRQAQSHARIFRPKTKEEQAKYDAFLKQQKEKWGAGFEAKMKDPKFKKEFEQKWSDFAKGEMERKLKNNYRGD